MRAIDAFLVLILKFVHCILLWLPSHGACCLRGNFCLWNHYSYHLAHYGHCCSSKNDGGLLILSMLLKLEISPTEIHRNRQKYLTEKSKNFYTIKQGDTKLTQHQATFIAWQY